MTNSQIKTQIDEWHISINHFFAMKDELNMNTVWSIYDVGLKNSDHAILTNKARKVVYETVAPNASPEDMMLDIQDGGKRTTIEVSAWAVDGTIKALWKAAETCIKLSGTHHSYIENFEMQDDGTLELVTGS